ncbi:hypothetical protein E2562_022493 [Oryza meyeriana var. granulata]|uniref:Uncharacterized protein n=1 Tax=Oryza meyeriana var. granulata TaxID=110450 RepID=A0A6G1BNA2_9ORYZ|nr:hypothetical protein E2562_022493 [Oryza meyeriana var. granulata]
MAVDLSHGTLSRGLCGTVDEAFVLMLSLYVKFVEFLVVKICCYLAKTATELLCTDTVWTKLILMGR